MGSKSSRSISASNRHPIGVPIPGSTHLSPALKSSTSLTPELTEVMKTLASVSASTGEGDVLYNTFWYFLNCERITPDPAPAPVVTTTDGAAAAATAASAPVRSAPIDFGSGGDASAAVCLVFSRSAESYHDRQPRPYPIHPVLTFFSTAQLSYTPRANTSSLSLHYEPVLDTQQTGSTAAAKPNGHLLSGKIIINQSKAVVLGRDQMLSYQASSTHHQLMQTVAPSAVTLSQNQSNQPIETDSTPRKLKELFAARSVQLQWTITRAAAAGKNVHRLKIEIPPQSTADDCSAIVCHFTSECPLLLTKSKIVTDGKSNVVTNTTAEDHVLSRSKPRPSAPPPPAPAASTTHQSLADTPATESVVAQLPQSQPLQQQPSTAVVQPK